MIEAGNEKYLVDECVIGVISYGVNKLLACLYNKNEYLWLIDRTKKEILWKIVKPQMIKCLRMGPQLLMNFGPNNDNLLFFRDE